MADRREAHRWEERGRRPTRTAGFRPNKGSFVMKLIALLVSCTRPLEKKNCSGGQSFQRTRAQGMDLKSVIEVLPSVLFPNFCRDQLQCRDAPSPTARLDARGLGRVSPT